MRGDADRMISPIKIMTKEQSTKVSLTEATDILIRNVPDIILAGFAPLIAVYPVLGVLIATGKGIYGAWGDFGRSRLNEFVKGLEVKKDSFNSKILETDKFKSLFLDTLERHMKESSNDRRHMLRCYLISVAQGKHPEFDYHTKLLSVLNQITGDELRLLMLLPNIIKDWDDEFMAHASADERMSFDPSKRQLQMNTVQIKMRLKNWAIKTRDLATLIRFLTNYGIIKSFDVSISGIGGGGSNDLVFVGFTDVGMIFYDYIDDSAFDKEITTFIEYRNNVEKNPLLRFSAND